ncbi:SCAN domain-containing protein 3-like [Octopus sinensis]|uniref:SCAN domain-containing protein 3-like n=1 Tax=Octopus sinensis TaxID=2607531 RepID=A0A6P7TBH1_9MOLL|nr:SCAN domain-containing protein 3-like [Octopus sinensis]
MRKTIRSFFPSSSSQSNDGLRASYNISLLIAKSGKPHTKGTAVKEVLKTVLHKASEPIIKGIPLSNSSVQRRVDEMAEVVEDQLCTILKKAEFSLPFDEFTFPGYDSLLAYVRFLKEESLCQELLFSRLLETNSEGESIFNVVKSFIDKKDIPLNNIVACATDGAPSMTDCHRGFISYLKVSSPDIFTMLCVIYRHLVARNLRSRLHDFLNTVITAGNKISCSKLSPISTALLRKRRRLSKLAAPNRSEVVITGNCVTHFHALFDSVL